MKRIFETAKKYCSLLTGKPLHCKGLRPSGGGASRQLGSEAAKNVDYLSKEVLHHSERNEFTHSPICSLPLKAAFTLAEVIIVIGVVGLVAALTLPTLISNHNKKVYTTQLKKSYSRLVNAYNWQIGGVSISEYCSNRYVDDPDCTRMLAKAMGATDILLNGEYTERLAYARTLNFSQNLLASVNAAFTPAAWAGDDYELVCGSYDCGGYDCGSYGCGGYGSNDCGVYGTPKVNSGFYKYNQPPKNVISVGTLGSGSFMGVSAIRTKDSAVYYFCCGGHILVDVNGPNKGPNQGGRDIFTFVRNYPHNNKLIPYGEGYVCDKLNVSDACTYKVLSEGNMNY